MSNNILQPIPGNLNVFLREFTSVFLNNTTPAPPGGNTNVNWQMDQFGNISAYYNPSGSSGLTFVSATLAPSSPGNFQVAHSLGKTPVGVIIQMTSGGQVWFQSPTLFDASNVYLVASDAGLTGFAQVFG